MVHRGPFFLPLLAIAALACVCYYDVGQPYAATVLALYLAAYFGMSMVPVLKPSSTGGSKEKSV